MELAKDGGGPGRRAPNSDPVIKFTSRKSLPEEEKSASLIGQIVTGVVVWTLLPAVSGSKAVRCSFGEEFAKLRCTNSSEAATITFLGTQKNSKAVDRRRTSGDGTSPRRQS